VSADASEAVRLLRDIARWTQLAARTVVQSKVKELLDSEAKRRVYEAISEGHLSIRNIEKATGVNHGHFQKWISGWQSVGLVAPNTNPPKALFTLAEFGIESPPARAVRPSRWKSATVVE
jgi:hypothetical protein